MNEIDILKAMNGVDERYYSEYESFKRKRKIKVSRTMKIGAAIAAAVAMLTIPAGAYAYEKFVHRENVEHYIEGTELIEQQSPDAVKNYVMENSDYCITIDTALSDGHNVMMVLTHHAKSIKGWRINEWVGGCPETYISYADGSPGPFDHTDWAGDIPKTMNFNGYAYDDKNTPFGYEKTVSIFSCKDIDMNKDIRIEFFSDSKDQHSAQLYYWRRDYPDILKSVAPDFDFDTKIKNELDGMEFTTSFAPNVKCVPLYDEDGTEIFMSAFEVYMEKGLLCNEENGGIDRQSLFFIAKDGGKTPLYVDEWKTEICSGSDGDYIIYGKFIDPDEYNGIEINGVKYLKTE